MIDEQKISQEYKEALKKYNEVLESITELEERLLFIMRLHQPESPIMEKHPETGRHKYIYGLTYESVVDRKCMAEIIKELMRQCSTTGYFGGADEKDVTFIMNPELLKLVETLEK